MKISMAELVAMLDRFGERDEDMDGNLGDAEPHVTLRNLGFDSLGIFNVIVQISDIYGKSVPYEAAMAADTPSQLLAVINMELSAQASE